MVKVDVIEINGKRYDSKSGEVLALNSKKTTDNVATSNPAKSSKVSKHSVANNRVAHKTEKATTLLRKAVKKPSFKNTKPSVEKLSPALESIAHETKTAGHAKLKTTESDQRSLRAKSVSKSPLVQKFNDFEPVDKMYKTEHIEVRRAPGNTPHASTPKSFDIKPAASPISPKPYNPFDSAVERAHSHEEVLAQVQKNKLPELISTFLMVTALFLFVTAGVMHFEAPSLDVSLASYHSTVNGSVPKWLPAGYSMKLPVQYTYNEVILNFVNNSSNLRLIEQGTDWSNTDLFNNFVSSSNLSFTSLSANNQTVYVFSDGSATWVKGSVWYELSSDTALSNSDIQNLSLNV